MYNVFLLNNGYDMPNRSPMYHPANAVIYGSRYPSIQQKWANDKRVVSSNAPTSTLPDSPRQQNSLLVKSCYYKRTYVNLIF